MIKSMTGYGRGQAERDAARYEVEVRGVNHRFLEVRVRLPQEIAGMEAALRRRVSEVVRRGRVDLSVSRFVARSPETTVTIHRELVAAYLEAARTLARDYRLSGDLSLDSVLGLPGAVTIEYEREEIPETERNILLDALDQALSGFEETRAREGERLHRDLADRLSAIEGELAAIGREAAGVAGQTLKKLREKMAALLENVPLDEVRLAQEAAYLAERSDVTEEIVRLRAHLEAAQNHLSSDRGPVGKPLDFVVQEMHREISTIGSKAESLAISEAVLRVKAEVEKLREQVQNLE